MSEFIEMLRSEESKKLMVQVWREGMNATTVHRLTGETIPDIKTRKDYLSLGMAYAEGLPVQRQEVHTVQWNGLKDIRARLKDAGWIQTNEDGALTLKNRAGDPPSEECASDESID